MAIKKGDKMSIWTNHLHQKVIEILRNDASFDEYSDLELEKKLREIKKSLSLTVYKVIRLYNNRASIKVPYFGTFYKKNKKYGKRKIQRKK
jgi:hypothetical protein